MADSVKKGGKARWIVLGVVVLLLLILVGTGTFVVKQNEYGVILQFGAVKDVKDRPGLYLKVPFVQTVTTLPNTVLLYDLPVSDLLSADKTSLIADCFAIWSIDDPRLFIETLSGSIENAESRINANVYNALKTVMSSMTRDQIISGRSGAVVEAIMQNIGDSFTRYGIALQAVSVEVVAHLPVQRVGIDAEIADRHRLEEPPERPYVVHKVLRPKAKRSSGNGRICEIPGVGRSYRGLRPERRAPRLRTLHDEYLPQRVKVRRHCIVVRAVPVAGRHVLADGRNRRLRALQSGV